MSDVSRSSALLQVQAGCTAARVRSRARRDAPVATAAEPSAPLIPLTASAQRGPGGVFRRAFVHTRHREALLAELALLRQRLRFFRAFDVAQGNVEALADETASLHTTAQEPVLVPHEPEAPPPLTRARARSAA